MKSHKIKKAVVPVAGKGTRMYPITKSAPKELLPIFDRPLLQFIIEEIMEAGIEEIIFITNRNKPAIQDYLLSPYNFDENGLHKGFGLHKDSIKLVFQDKPRGLGHAVLCAKEVVGDDDFALILPDDLIFNKTGCLKQLIDNRPNGNSAIFASMPVKYLEVSKYGIIEGNISDQIIKVENLLEKPNADDTSSRNAIIGRYILPNHIFTILEEVANSHDGKGEIQITDSILKLSKNTPVYGYLFDGERYDCGSISGWSAANNSFKNKLKA